tara:strand:+ start:907 stop:1305 length:399 start_codon:yes stop_codon:yes gene_type:complete
MTKIAKNKAQCIADLKRSVIIAQNNLKNAQNNLKNAQNMCNTNAANAKAANAVNANAKAANAVNANANAANAVNANAVNANANAKANAKLQNVIWKTNPLSEQPLSEGGKDKTKVKSSKESKRYNKSPSKKQ